MKNLTLILSFVLAFAGLAQAAPGKPPRNAPAPEVPQFDPGPAMDRVQTLLKQMGPDGRQLLQAIRAQQKGPQKLEELPPFKDSRVLQDVYRLIRSVHITTNASDRALYYGAIKGMVDAVGDPFSHFLDPREARIAFEAMGGEVSGIGAQVGTAGDELVIQAVIDGSPALKAGLQKGDVIVAIDGRPVKGLGLAKASKLMRGSVGTPVNLTVTRAGAADPITVTLMRAIVVVPSVKHHRIERDGKLYLHVVVTSFDEKTGELFAKAVQYAVDNKVSGIVLDLRDNGGGYMHMAGAVSCQWLPPGVPYTYLRHKDGLPQAFQCPTKGHHAWLAKLPTAVLQNGDSASASEVTAMALRDNKKAVVIGQKSFGKGCGQDIVPFEDGSALILVTFLWFSPNGTSIHRTGLQPDIAVTGNAEQLERAVQYLQTGK